MRWHTFTVAVRKICRPRHIIAQDIAPAMPRTHGRRTPRQLTLFFVIHPGSLDFRQTSHKRDEPH